MTAATIIFPHQLFKNHPSIVTGQTIYLVEEWLFFKQYNFHQQKLLLHRASMQHYLHYLVSQNFKVEYIECNNPLSDVRKLITHLSNEKITEIHIAAVADNWLQKRIATSCKKAGIQIYETATPNFLNTPEEVKPFFDKKKKIFSNSVLYRPTGKKKYTGRCWRPPKRW